MTPTCRSDRWHCTGTAAGHCTNGAGQPSSGPPIKTRSRSQICALAHNRQHSRQLLAAFGADATRAACLADLKRWKGRGALGYDEKDATLGKWKRDFTVDAYFTYMGLGDKVEELVVAGTPAHTLFVRQRWITEPRAQSIKVLLAGMLP